MATEVVLASHRVRTIGSYTQCLCYIYVVEPYKAPFSRGTSFTSGIKRVDEVTSVAFGVRHSLWL